jgi:cytochrome c oxidase subunit 2
MFALVEFLAYSDAPKFAQIGIQDPASVVVEAVILFHNFLLVFLTIIGVIVCFLLAHIIKTYNSDNYEFKNIIKFSHSSILEIVWTIIPAVLLLWLAIPSFNLLYSLDEIIDPSLTLKIVGHQWYWSYEYSDYALLDSSDSLNFDSYMITTKELTKGSFRLLEVDNRIVLPIQTHIRLLVTAADVLHSWTIPSFGIKIDACPGRLSQASLFLKRIGVYYGQCSEICGVNHGFMPIVVQGVSPKNFIKWIILKLDLATN